MYDDLTFGAAVFFTQKRKIKKVNFTLGPVGGVEV